MEALDLTKEFPRSPREKLGKFIIAGRTLDKCRATINGTAGEYHFNCPLDETFFEFANIDAEEFKEKAKTANDEEMAKFINEKTNKSDDEIIQWNNKYRYMKIDQMDLDSQKFLEEYIDEVVPKGKIVYYWFDVYDIEEGRI